MRRALQMAYLLLVILLAFSGCLSTMGALGRAASEHRAQRSGQSTRLSSLFLEGELHLVSPDGTYLGKLTTNKYDSDSFLNTYGEYGNKYSDTSIWNKFSEYGGAYSDKSPFNKLATSPPLIVSSSGRVGYLTTNRFLPGAVDPYALIAYLGKR